MLITWKISKISFYCFLQKWIAWGALSSYCNEMSIHIDIIWPLRKTSTERLYDVAGNGRGSCRKLSWHTINCPVVTKQEERCKGTFNGKPEGTGIQGGWSIRRSMKGNREILQCERIVRGDRDSRWQFKKWSTTIQGNSKALRQLEHSK